MSFDFRYNYPQIARDTGFILRQFKDGPLDWRRVASLEVEKIIREQQFEHIDSILFYLSEAPIASLLETNILDSGIAKYFTLTQLAIQYLLFCRKFLDETVCTLREKLTLIENENTNLKTINREHSNEIVLLHKKINQIEAISDIVYPCHVCTKNFVSNDALNIHLSRKHSNLVADGLSKDNDKSLINAIKLELEIKQLKERLNSAEKEIRESVGHKNQRDVAKASSSTQISIQMKDASTQSNLIETKESDSTEDEYDKKDALRELQRNIANLEHWQEKQFENNQFSIKNINHMLEEMMQVLQSKCRQDEETLGKMSTFASVPYTAAPAEEIKTILTKAISEIVSLNSEKLNEIQFTIESICKDILPSLTAIQKSRESTQDNNLLSNQDKQRISDFEKTIYREKELLEIQCQNTNTDEVNSMSSKISFGSNQPGSNQSENGSECNLNYRTNNTEKQKSLISVIRQPAFNVKGARKVLEKNMLLFGIKPTEGTLSASEVNKVSSNLEKRRHSLKNTYPRFYATRNKLKTLVEELSHRKVNHATSSIPISRISRNHKQYTAEPQNTNKIVLENKVKQILNSPVKSPKTLPKPIPLPRKRVMFNNIE